MRELRIIKAKKYCWLQHKNWWGKWKDLEELNSGFGMKKKIFFSEKEAIDWYRNDYMRENISFIKLIVTTVDLVE